MSDKTATKVGKLDSNGQIYKMSQEEHNKSKNYLFVGKTEYNDSTNISNTEEHKGKECHEHGNNAEYQITIKTEVIEEETATNYILKEEHTKLEFGKQIIVNGYTISQVEDNKPLDYFLVPKTENSESIVINSNTEEEFKERSKEQNIVGEQKAIKVEVIEQIYDNNRTSDKEHAEGKEEKQINVEESTNENPLAQNIDFYSRFINHSNLVPHIGMHPERNVYNICDTQYITAPNLNNQLETDCDEQKFACDQCSKRFKKHSTLIYHIRNHTGEKPYACNICDKKFTHAWPLTKHLRTHSGEKRYSCDQCSKRFQTHSGLVYHTRSHTGIKPYLCSICDKQFASPTTLKNHLRTHSDERDYTCDQCSRQFKHRYSLVYHIRTHTGEKPYACNICDKKFTHSQHLKNHMTTHSSEKKYACDQCNKSYKSHDDLVNHIRVHTDVKPYFCNICYAVFASSSVWENHLKTHTNDSMPAISVVKD